MLTRGEIDCGANCGISCFLGSLGSPELVEFQELQEFQDFLELLVLPGFLLGFLLELLVSLESPRSSRRNQLE